MVGVVAGRVKDRNADNAVSVDCDRVSPSLALSTLSCVFLTIWVPDVALELHGRRHERVVLWEFELCWEDSAFVWCSLGALDHRLPEEKVIFVDGACCDALGRVGGKVLVLLEEALGGY